jgi:hypothetical protein
MSQEKEFQDLLGEDWVGPRVGVVMVMKIKIPALGN